MEILNSTEIKNLAVTIQCTWANCFTEPEWNSGLCIRSFDRRELARQGDTTGGIIGTLTGNYCTDAKGVLWVEANLKYTNRRPTGWFRVSDIWFSSKGTPLHPADKPQEKTSVNWIAWLTGGVTIFRLITG